ncbi:hypothetical protein L596_005407 [Steinernema carpocapsae]|uniref:Uncharacterized protein n=1 Tax=Steinernema carpocapsae TaxID=34508 RepID=A0A4U8UYX9_STECR|nr:hypothetical protein L596_005407 [Steinernema carpocapsae]
MMSLKFYVLLFIGVMLLSGMLSAPITKEDFLDAALNTTSLATNSSDTGLTETMEKDQKQAEKTTLLPDGTTDKDKNEVLAKDKVDLKPTAEASSATVAVAKVTTDESAKQEDGDSMDKNEGEAVAEPKPEPEQVPEEKKTEETQPGKTSALPVQPNYADVDAGQATTHFMAYLILSTCIAATCYIGYQYKRPIKVYLNSSFGSSGSRSRGRRTSARYERLRQAHHDDEEEEIIY